MTRGGDGGEQEVVSLVNQLARCYSCNNGSTHCLQFHLTSFGGKTEERLKTVLSGFENWRNVPHTPTHTHARASH
jgi:hypothetical protein